MRLILSRAALALLAVGLARPSAAHPHMFVEASSELMSGPAGALTGLRTTMLIDELTSLYVLEENQIDRMEGPLTETEQTAIGAGMVEGLGTYDYFTSLAIDGARQDFATARVTRVWFEGPRLAATLELTLAAPIAPAGRAIELDLYDPTYYAAVETTRPPVLPPPLAGCEARLIRFEASNLDEEALAALSVLSREETPEDPRIGARFADRSVVTCSE